jgi:hypothetical protein
MPVFFHNGSGYDFKHFIRKLYKFHKNLRETEEKYFSISVNVDETNITFKSATVLNKNNNGGLNNFKNLVSFFRKKYTEITDDILELLVQKGVFPYEYLDSFERLNETEYPSF